MPGFSLGIRTKESLFHPLATANKQASIMRGSKQTEACNQPQPTGTGAVQQGCCQCCRCPLG